MNLSLTGRVTQDKYVLQAIPSYVMQTSMIPKGLCDVIDHKYKGFIWGDTHRQRQVHLTSWGSICTPKSYAWLGLRTARNMNLTAMMIHIANSSEPT